MVGELIALGNRRRCLALLAVEGPALDLGDAIENILAVPCDEPHTHEVYAQITYEENDVYPGAAELERFSDVACLTDFPDYVGVDYFDSGLFFTYLYPTLDGWNDKNDREVVCLAALPGQELIESVRGSGGEFDVFIPPPIEGEGTGNEEGNSTS